MGRQIILSEEEKKNIQKMYGLINEQPIPPNSSNVARAVSTIANGGKTSDAARKTLNSSKNIKFEKIKGGYDIDENTTPDGFSRFIGKNVSNKESGTNYIIVSLHPFEYKGDVSGIVLHLSNEPDDKRPENVRARDPRRSPFMYYMCNTDKWYSSNGQELMSDFNEEFYSIGNMIKNNFCKFKN
jgi:hypothetical protein